MKKKESRIPGFYNLSLTERQAALQDWLSPQELSAWGGEARLDPEQASHMIENVVGMYALPLGIALNFMVNGQDVLVPMAVEEPSIVAGASFMARLARQGALRPAIAPAPRRVLSTPPPRPRHGARLSDAVIAERGETR